mmetsp:Transcript_9688/g.19592  ORF Transcript_9688/g.19592 Transcript_9688/m.19592 type:complete len:396 (+) Transcript_9688:371-1558(+)
MESTFSGETSTHCDTNSTEREHVQCLGAALFEIVVQTLRPESRTNSTGDKRGGSNGNTEEKESANEALTNTTRGLFHDTVFGGFDCSDETQSDSTDQVTVKHLNGRKRGLVQTEEETKEDRHTLSVVDGSVHKKDLTQIVPHNTTFTNSSHDGSKVVISQNHLGSLAGNISSFFTHGNTHISGLESRSIVDAISGHTADFTFGLEGLDNSNLVLRGSTSENVVLLGRNFQLVVIHGVHFGSSNSFRVLLVNQTKHSSNSESSILVITGNHGNTHTSSVGNGDSFHTLGSRGVHDGAKTNNRQPGFAAFLNEFRTKLFAFFDGSPFQRTTSQGEHPETMRRKNGNLFDPVVLFAGFKIGLRKRTTLSLVLAKRNHTVRSTLHMNDELVHKIFRVVL